MKERKDLPAYLFFEFVLYFKNTLFNTNCYNLNNYKKPSRKTWIFKLDTLLFKSNVGVKPTKLVIKHFSINLEPVGVFVGVLKSLPPFAINQLFHYQQFAHLYYSGVNMYSES